MSRLSTLNCPHFSVCSGCEVEGDLLPPPVTKEIEKFLDPIGIPFHFLMGNAKEWRIRSKLAVRNSAAPRIGLFHKNSHYVEEIPSCQVHNPLINEASKILKRGLIDFSIPGYDEKKNKGLLRYAQFWVEEKTNTVQLTLVVFSNTISSDLQKLIGFLKSQKIFHSIWINFHPQASNRIFGDKWQHISGPLYVQHDLLSFTLYFHPACFVQANFSMFEKMITSIREKITPSQNVVELYAGTGSIGFSVLDISQNVICNDLNPFNEECFHKTRDDLPIHQKEKISYVHGEAKVASSYLKDADVLILDPPRKGLDPYLFQEINNSKTLKQIFYVSCFWKSCQKDLEKFLEMGWKISSLDGYLFFPGTNHIETLCVLKKSG